MSSTELTTALTDDERVELANAEETIREGFNTFVHVAKALMRIRAGRLYRGEYKSFETYCRAKWGHTRFYASRLIKASSLLSSLYTDAALPIGNISESLLRPLHKLKDPEKQKAAFSKAVTKAKAEGRQPAARDVEAAVREIAPPAVEDAEYTEVPRPTTTTDAKEKGLVEKAQSLYTMLLELTNGLCPECKSKHGELLARVSGKLGDVLAAVSDFYQEHGEAPEALQ